VESGPEASAIEENSFDSIESQSSMMEQAIQQVARFEEQYPVTSLFLIDELIEQQ
jgi:hypothetical protein